MIGSSNILVIVDFTPTRVRILIDPNATIQIANHIWCQIQQYIIISWYCLRYIKAKEGNFILWNFKIGFLVWKNNLWAGNIDRTVIHRINFVHCTKRPCFPAHSVYRYAPSVGAIRFEWCKKDIIWVGECFRHVCTWSSNADNCLCIWIIFFVRVIPS